MPAIRATLMTEQEKEDHLFVSMNHSYLTKLLTAFFTVTSTEFRMLQSKFNPNKLRNWKEAMQHMVLELYSFQELLVSCPTEKGQKSSSMDRKALDPVRLRTIYGELTFTDCQKLKTMTLMIRLLFSTTKLSNNTRQQVQVSRGSS